MTYYHRASSYFLRYFMYAFAATTLVIGRSITENGCRQISHILRPTFLTALQRSDCIVDHEKTGRQLYIWGLLDDSPLIPNSHRSTIGLLGKSVLSRRIGVGCVAESLELL